MFTVTATTTSWLLAKQASDPFSVMLIHEYAPMFISRLEDMNGGARGRKRGPVPSRMQLLRRGGQRKDAMEGLRET